MERCKQSLQSTTGGRVVDAQIHLTGPAGQGVGDVDRAVFVLGNFVQGLVAHEVVIHALP